MTIDLSTRLVRSGEPIAVTTGEGALMFSAEQDRYYGLNEVAAAIWEQTATPTTARAICDHLQATFDVSPEECAAAALPFLQQLLERKLLLLAP